jgi:lipooligosaccharide transport system ATP-binding protein
MSQILLNAQGVSKRYGDFVALAGLDLQVSAGECVGLLGPNGAGKSTLIGILYGVVARNGGSLEVFELDPAKQARALKHRLGVVPQENALDDGLTVMENMRLYARFVGLPAGEADARILELLDYMLLAPKKDALIKELSGGMKRRLAFVRALLGDPELVILDEPTTGLDPAVRHLLWEKVLHLKTRGKTVLITTHYIHEAEVLCDRVVIMSKGRVIDSGTPKDLIRQHAPGFVATFASDSAERLRSRLPEDSNGWQLFEQGKQDCVRAPRLDDLLSLQERSGLGALQMRPANLEDVFLKLTGEGLSHDA